MCGDSGIDSILITHPDRVARQRKDIDLADSYVPFEPPQAPGADSINTERMLGSAFAVILVAGFIFGLLLLGNMVAHGNAIPSLKGVIYAQQGK